MGEAAPGGKFRESCCDQLVRLSQTHVLFFLGGFGALAVHQELFDLLNVFMTPRQPQPALLHIEKDSLGLGVRSHLGALLALGGALKTVAVFTTELPKHYSFS